MAQDTQDTNAALSALFDLQNSHEFSIIKISDALSAESGGDGSGAASRTSDISNDSLKTSSPASLEADLAHYKDLFSKLRFSYLEQVTKEKFLRAIVGDPPLIVEHEENINLEARLVESKASLKAQKAEVAEMVAELESQGQSLSRRYEIVQEQLRQVRELPSSIDELRESIASLHAESATDSRPCQSLPLPATLSLLAEEEDSLEQLHRELSGLESTLSRKTREFNSMQTELKPLEMQRHATDRAAKEALKRKAGLDGDADDLEGRGRWWKGVGEGLKMMLEAEAS